jgi:ATP-dependent DNA helicase RecG
MAENGYQGVLMAPTSILAKQHYEEFKTYGDRFHIPVAYLDGSVPAVEKKKILEGLKSGDIKIVIGTHTLANGKCEYANLGMTVIDEEHRFGVEQKNALLKEAERGVNTILMSATPMPHTIAGSMHGNNVKIYDIRTMPASRIPVQTAINSSDRVIFDFIEKQLKEGRQAYVVCPLIEKNEESEAMAGVISVTDTAEMYKKRFPGYKIGVLSGRLDEEETDDTIRKFKDGETDILISTTVVEVGVNVPNASVIVISNAERFGLAAMHQLRGRVGRGSYKSYCILKSSEKDNERLNTLVNCSSGFDIAEQDLKLRGAGELTGTRQSGFTHCMELVMEYPNLFGKLKELAKEMVDLE